ncbi:MAG TPA: radical SAM protein [Chloroflexota bacterium]|nr:radical SAM protein [Chloroflexota bacterium]
MDGVVDQTAEDRLIDSICYNRGTRDLRKLTVPDYPDAGPTIRAANGKQDHRVDVLLANPPSPDGAIWIRSQHRVGRRSRENMIWPQVSLAQLAALVPPGLSVEIVDAIATRMDWSQFERMLREKRPRLYLTQVTGPTLTNDMYGVFLAKSLGAWTIGFGTHVTPMPRETMEPFPCLDFVIRGEPEYTFKELVETLSGESRGCQGDLELPDIAGLVWRRGKDIVVNPDRPFISDLDALPLPLHEMLPLDRYRVPMFEGPFTFIVTSRGCPAGCSFCIKHVSYQYSVRVRSPESIQQELWVLNRLGIHNVHMYADLFTANREQVVGLCELLLREGPKVRWTCNSRVDHVDEEMLRLMGRAGCWFISWGIESASKEILHRARKGTDPEMVERALQWARAAGIKNWGYFIIGLPGETEETIRQTIQFSKKLPLDLALFHVAAPHPGTPFFFEVMANNWFRPGTRWEEVDMDRSTVLDYPHLSAEELERWQKKAFLEWAMRPGPMATYLQMLATPGALRSALEVGIRHLSWARS